MTKLPTLLLPLTVLALACTPKDGSGDDGAAATTGTDPTGADPSTGGSDGMLDGTGSEEVDIPARGVEISLVEANTGVAVPVGAYGEWVGPQERNAPLPKGRNTAVRVYVDVLDEGSWVQRDIEARLHIHLPDGTVETLSEVSTIAEDSSTTSLQSGFIFGVLGEWMVPGVKYQVELFEAGTGWESLPAVDAPPRTPAEPDYLGAQDDELTMKIVMVPVDYSYGACSTTIDRTDEVLQPYEDALFQQNPVETLEISWHDPITVDDLDLGNSGDFFSLLGRASQLRASESPPPNVYYYVLFDNCGVCIGDGGGCLLGVAPGQSDASMGAAGLRVAIGTRYLSGSEVGVGTFVHEIGHTQGRAHVTCPGADAAGPDPSYPYENGVIGVWGFGVRDFEIRNATTFTDYMSYCEPTWVSDWQWSATFDRIRTLTSWDSASVGMPPDQAVLVGSINPETGEAMWWTDRGYIADAVERPAGHSLRFMAGDTVLETATVAVDHWSEGPGITVRAPLPQGFEDEVTAIEYLAPEQSFQAPRAAVHTYHRPDALTQP